MTDHIYKPGQTAKRKHVMLKKEMDSHIIFIAACAHHKDDNKQSEDT